MARSIIGEAPEDIGGGSMGITIKGKSGGVLEIAMQPLASYADIRLSVSEKLAKNKDFFTGTDVKVRFSGKVLSAAQKKELRRILFMDYDIKNVTFLDEEPEGLEEVSAVTSGEAPAESPNRVSLVSKDYFNAKSVFVSHTLRSGQRVECEGDIVVLGDVNDGAEVIAGGSIAVMGALRGLAHAGRDGPQRRGGGGQYPGAQAAAHQRQDRGVSGRQAGGYTGGRRI